MSVLSLNAPESKVCASQQNPILLIASRLVAS